MCGILGVRRSWCAAGEPFAGAVRAMQWRGPDGVGTVETGDWRLAVARLAITDAGTDPPLVCPDTGDVVLFNGAVTDADEVRGRLRTATRTGNDAELFLHRLHEGGPAAAGRWRGHGALALIRPGRDGLVLARDPAGEKPLFVLEAGGRVVAFASTPASLNALGVRTEMTRAGVGTLFRYGFGPAPSATGGELHADLEGAWVQDRDGPFHRMPLPAEDPGQGTLRERIVAATGRCARTEVPAALALSGGIDSSCLAFAAAEGGRPLPAYQLRARGDPPGERERARTVAAAAGLELRAVDVGPDVVDALPALTAGAGRPLGDPSVLAVHALARSAAADGVRVLLGGEGADEAFLGYRRHRAARWPLRLPGPAPRWSMAAWARLWRATRAPDAYAGLLEVTPPAFRARLLEPDVVGDGALGGDIGSLDRTYLRQDLLPKLDTATMAAGVEGRCPYLDPAVRLAPEAVDPRPGRRLGKRALRRAFADRLPAAVRRQRKRGFALPLDRWLRGDSTLHDLLAEPRTRQRDHLRPGALAELVDRHRSGRIRVGHGLYLVAAYELWLRGGEASA